MGFFFEKNPMTNKIKKFLYTLEHLIPDAHEEIPTFAIYHPLLLVGTFAGNCEILRGTVDSSTQHA